MRKQTKVVAVASAAALLAIGGAMTSFAAQGWVEEDGTWYYYDKDGCMDYWFFVSPRLRIAKARKLILH